MWITENNKLTKSYKFESFNEAFEFLSKVAIIADEQKHHPEIYNLYNRVTLSLTTNDKNNTVTERDYQLSKAIDRI